MHGQWINFCYHYGVGGAFFLLTIKLLYSGGALSWERPSDRLVTKGLFAGILTFALIHFVWISAVTKGS